MSWGVQVRGFGYDADSTCWRCLQEPVPEDDDHIGLCPACLADLQARDPMSLQPQKG
jgi:hypothetical protein